MVLENPVHEIMKNYKSLKEITDDDYMKTMKKSLLIELNKQFTFGLFNDPKVSTFEDG